MANSFNFSWNIIDLSIFLLILVWKLGKNEIFLERNQRRESIRKRLKYF